MPQLIETRDDLKQPIQLIAGTKPVLEGAESFNRYLLSQRQSHGKRTIIRLGWEVWTRKGSNHLQYARLRGKTVTLSCPDADQAQLVIDAIEQVCKSLHGKHLAKE